MSFSSTAKAEICRMATTAECCELSELSALVNTAGSVRISEGVFSLRIDTENAAVARRAFLLLKNLYGLLSVMRRHTNQLKRNHIYSISVEKAAARMVALDVGILGDGGFGFGENMPSLGRRCCNIAFVRGAFLGGGSITNPERRYHLEFVCGQEEFARVLLNTIGELGIPARTIPRGKNHVVYLKEGDAIITLLTMIGAHTSILSIENIRILKGIRNNVNRKVNCETGNLTKTVNASIKQQESIAYISAHMGLEKLSAPLRETASARLDNPQATLDELTVLLGAVSKSGVNHRLRKLCGIADQLKTTRGE
ncbi:MAG: DNA-binding protein WhiA [Christensenellales bacterium]